MSGDEIAVSRSSGEDIYGIRGEEKKDGGKRVKARYDLIFLRLLL